MVAMVSRNRVSMRIGLRRAGPVSVSEYLVLSQYIAEATLSAGWWAFAAVNRKKSPKLKCQKVVS